MTGTQAGTFFRLAYVPGVTPGKWARTWIERLPDVRLDLLAVSAVEAAEALRRGGADAALVRLPIDRTGLSAIPLYTETSVLVVPKDHEASAVDEVSIAELAHYIVLHPLDDSLAWDGPESTGSKTDGPQRNGPPGLPANERPATTADAVDLVAAGTGLLVVPQSLARLYHRRDLTYRPMPDAPQSQVALSWPEDRTTDLMEEFIGIVRGRTVNSSRGRAQTSPAEAASAKAKTQAKQKRDEQKRDESGGARRKPASGGSGSSATRSGAAGSGGSRGAKRGKPRPHR